LFSGDENKLQLLDLGAMESLIRLINHEEKTVKRYACMAFGVMAGHCKYNKATILKCILFLTLLIYFARYQVDDYAMYI